MGAANFYVKELDKIYAIFPETEEDFFSDIEFIQEVLQRKLKEREKEANEIFNKLKYKNIDYSEPWDFVFYSYNDWEYIDRYSQAFGAIGFANINIDLVVRSGYYEGASIDTYTSIEEEVDFDEEKLFEEIEYRLSDALDVPLYPDESDIEENELTAREYVQNLMGEGVKLTRKEIFKIFRFFRKKDFDGLKDFIEENIIQHDVDIIMELVSKAFDIIEDTLERCTTPLCVSAKFSNGETWYSPCPKAKQKGG